MTITLANVNYMWQTVIIPRVGDIYAYGGSLSATAVNNGTDCSGAVSEADEGIEYGAPMDWLRQFYTGTFGGAQPGQRGPYGGCDLTSDWTCISGPDAAPPGAAMIVAVLQLPDPTEAHMVCAVLDPDNVTGYGGPGKYVGIESGGQFTDANGNSTLHIGPEATSVSDPMFNQWFCTGPIVDVPPAPPAFTPVQGVDYSAGRIRAAALAAAGYTFAIRYVFDGSPDLPFKLLTQAEASALAAGGIAPVSNYESTGTDMGGAFTQGAADATDAQANHAAAGGPPARPIYFSVDYDAPESDQPMINAYFQGVASVIGLARTGAYAGYWVIKRLFDAGLITWGWQAQAWSDNPEGLAPVGPNGCYLDPRANLLQVTSAAGIIDGVQCDVDTAYTADFGQWGYVPPATPGGFLMALTDQQQLDVWTALCGPVASQSPFATPGEGAIWTTPKMSQNDDGFIHPMYTAFAAYFGQPWAIATLSTTAAIDLTANPSETENVALAQAILGFLGGAGAPVPAPAPAPDVAPPPAPAAPGTININTAQLLQWGKDLLTILGTLGTWATAAHNLLGQYLPGASGTAVPAALAVATTGLAAHTVRSNRVAQKQLVTLKGTPK